MELSAPPAHVDGEALQAFVDDPLREEKLGWTAAIACRLCGATLKKLPQHLIAFHASELREEPNSGSEAVAEVYRKKFGFNKNAPLMAPDSRKRLVDAATQRKSRRRLQGRSPAGSQTRFSKTRNQREKLQSAAQDSAREWGVSQQARQRMSRARMGRPVPARWKQTNDGSSISDWKLAKLRLRGLEAEQIARKLGATLTSGAVVSRLRRIGFPAGKPCRFWMGEPVSDKHLLALFEDLKHVRLTRRLRATAARVSDAERLTVTDVAALLGVSEPWVREHTRERDKTPIPHKRAPRAAGTGRGGHHLEFFLPDVLAWAEARHHGKIRGVSSWSVEKELAERLGVSAHRVYEFVVHAGGPPSRGDGRVTRRRGHPLSLRLADKLTSSQASLRAEFRKLGAGPLGGRPKALLPSEAARLPQAYESLRTALTEMLQWARREDGRIMPETLGAWLCEQSRLGRCQCVLFRGIAPTLVEACDEAHERPDGPPPAAKCAKTLLAKELGISPKGLEAALKKGSTRL